MKWSNLQIIPQKFSCVRFSCPIGLTYSNGLIWRKNFQCQFGLSDQFNKSEKVFLLGWLSI